MEQMEIPLEMTSFNFTEVTRVPTRTHNLFVVECTISSGFTVVGSYMAFPNEIITDDEGYHQAYLDAVENVTSLNPSHKNWEIFQEYAVKDIDNG